MHMWQSYVCHVTWFIAITKRWYIPATYQVNIAKTNEKYWKVTPTTGSENHEHPLHKTMHYENDDAGLFECGI